MLLWKVDTAFSKYSLCDAVSLTALHSFFKLNELYCVTLCSASVTDETVIIIINSSTSVAVIVEWATHLTPPTPDVYRYAVVFRDGL
jgi:hypothetical protein